MKNSSVEWKLFNSIAAVCVISAMLVMLMEIMLTALPDGARIQLSIQQILEMYNRNWFMGMRYMGLMNLFYATLMMPVFYALYGVHKDSNKIFVSFALLIALLGYSIFISDNVSLPILELSKKFSAASEGDKMALITATEALFAKGASHTPGTFPGIFLNLISSFLFSIIMIKGKQFKKVTGIIGVTSSILLLVFEIMSSFIPTLYDFAMIFAMIGGISALIWNIAVGMELIKLNRKCENSKEKE